MDRAEHQLRQQHRAEHRHAERNQGGQRRRPERGVEVAANQQRRDPDPDRAELGVAEQQRLAELEVHPLAPINRAELVHRRSIEDRVQVGRIRNPAAFERRVGVRHRHTVGIDDRRKRDVLRVQARLEDRSQARIAVQRLVRVDPRDHDLAGAMKHRVGQQFRPRLAFVQAHAGEPRQLHQAQHHDDDADDRRHAKNLLALDA
jgi:hypothetical protein